MDGRKESFVLPNSIFSLEQVPLIDWSEKDCVLEENSQTEFINICTPSKIVKTKCGILENIDFSIDYIYRIEKYSLIS